MCILTGITGEAILKMSKISYYFLITYIFKIFLFFVCLSINKFREILPLVYENLPFVQSKLRQLITTFSIDATTCGMQIQLSMEKRPL